jgi:extradiol dioxygenase family protein
MDGSPSFHLSLVTTDLARQRAFYTEVLGCKLARTAPTFEDYDFFGHQLTFHQSSASLGLPYETLHFGAAVDAETFERLHMRLLAAAVRFVVALEVQAGGTDDERRKFVFLDPSDYAVELKCYVNQARALTDAAAYPRLPARGP